MNKNHVMIDLETLGTAPNSVILSIGAVSFDASGIRDEFYCVVNTDSCLDHGLVIEPRTLEWWSAQDEEAAKVLSEAMHGGLALPIALNALASAFDWENTLVWCNGLAFDLPMLDTAYRACGSMVPWAYYNTRDYRTLRYELDSATRNRLDVEPKIAHHALEDAKAQALTLSAIRALQCELRKTYPAESAA